MSRQPEVLVTGASGFIGRHLCRHLQAAGLAVGAFSRSHPARKPARDTHSTHPSWDTHFAGDILDPKALEKACAGVRAVFHLAGIARTADRSDASAMQVNVEGTRNLLETARNAGAQSLVLVSSALAAEFDGRDSPSRPGDYARSKWLAERLVLEANGREGMRTTILRPAPVYGAGMKGGIARLIRLIHARRLPPLPRLDSRFSLAGVDDVCRAAMLAWQDPEAAGQCWLLTDLHDYRANAIEHAIHEALGRNPPRWHTPAMVFFAAAALLQFGRLAGSKSTEPGLQAWRNMTSERVWPSRDIYQALDFQPSGDLYAKLPEIIQELTGHQAPTRE